MPINPAPPPSLSLRARGATSNVAGRFEARDRTAEADGWDREEEPSLLRTEVDAGTAPLGDHPQQLARSAV